VIARGTPPTPRSRAASGHATDVIVVGGGPAGATAARRLALGGVAVTVLDKSAFPRAKPCGGAISMRVLPRFPYLERELSRISTHLISRLHLESPAGESATLESRGPAALMIRRSEFDGLLLDLAREAGARVIEDTDVVRAAIDPGGGIVVQARDGRTFRAAAAIAADGVHSVLARRLGFRREWARGSIALDMMEETPRASLRAVDPGTLWVGYGYGGSKGYAYVFPKRDHVNVGVGYLLSYYRERVGRPPYSLQREFVADLTGRGVLAGESSRAAFTPFLIPVGGPAAQTMRDNVFLTGDAGGFVNGFTAEGIYYAMVTGDLAAASILAGTPRTYERAWRREIGAELADSITVQRYLFGRPGRVDRMVRGARDSPDLALALVDYAMARLSYRAARRRLLVRSPRLLLSILAARMGERRARLGPEPGSRVQV
jgi:geranylgeranyl reductase family protein